MEKKLGKGLEALISEDLGKAKEKVEKLKLSEIIANPSQPRKRFGKEKMEELVNSIREKGVIKQIVVRPTDRGYELIAGERRLRAAQVLQMEEVPVIVRSDITDANSLEISLIENIQRDDLNALEEARAYKRLNEEFNMSQAEIAQRISKSRPHVANVMRILSLPQNIQNALSRGEINEGHTRPLLSLNMSDSQEKLFEEIKRQGMTVRDPQ